MGFYDERKKRQDYEDYLREKADLRRVRRDIDSLRKERQREDGLKLGQKVIGSFGRGIHNIAESLSHPSDKRRPRISQLPAKRSDMDLSRSANLDLLKTREMRRRDIRGRLIKPSRNKQS